MAKLNTLPDEILVTVFTNLQSLNSILLVCKRWNRVCTKSPFRGSLFERMKLRSPSILAAEHRCSMERYADIRTFSLDNNLRTHRINTDRGSGASRDHQNEHDQDFGAAIRAFADGVCWNDRLENVKVSILSTYSANRSARMERDERMTALATRMNSTLVSRCPNLQSLSVLVLTLNDDQVRLMCSGMRLRKLDLWGCHLLTIDSVRAICENMADTLTDLSIGAFRIAINDAALEMIGSRLTKLQHLKLSRCSVTDDGIHHLRHLSQLQTLDISFCERVTEDIFRNTLGPYMSSTLMSLNVRRCAIRGYETYSNIRLHSLGHYDTTVAEAPTTLSATQDEEASAVERSIRSMSTLSKLQHLNLKSTYIDTSVLRNLSRLPLKVLDISECGYVRDEGIMELFSHDLHRHLEELNLEECTALTDMSMECVFRGDRDWTRMRKLQITACCMTDRTVLNGLCHLHNLVHLDIMYALNLTDSSVYAIIKSMPRLRRLTLSKGKRLSCEALSRLTELQHLEYLKLNYCTQLDPSTVSHLLNNLTNLTTFLALGCDGIPDFMQQQYTAQ